MGSVPVGRIVYIRQALPAVELVNFALDHGDIVIKTDGGSKLAAATRNAVVAIRRLPARAFGFPPGRRDRLTRDGARQTNAERA